MKQNYARRSLEIAVAMLVIVGFFAAPAGGRVCALCLVSVFTLPPIISGYKRDRVIAIGRLGIIITLAIIDYRVGRQFRNKLQGIDNQQIDNASP